jgi:hypothetical protein
MFNAQRPASMGFGIQPSTFVIDTATFNNLSLIHAPSVIERLRRRIDRKGT